MNSFTLTAVGNLAKNPELTAKGEIMYTRFCLVGIRDWIISRGKAVFAKTIPNR